MPYKEKVEEFVSSLDRKTVSNYAFIAFIVFSAWLLLSIIFIDQRWWWFVLVVFMVGIATLILKKEELYRPSLLREQMAYTMGWASFLTFFLVVINALFISPHWWFGLFLFVAVFFVWASFISIEETESRLPYEIKESLRNRILVGFFVIFLLFCVPSFIANSKRNPQDRFSTSHSTVESYSIYGETIYNPRDHEHIIPVSWYQTERHYVNDHVNIIWSNRAANNNRGNLPFGHVKKTQDNAIYSGDIVVGYKDESFFMPTEEYIGDVARIVLYMYVTYQNDGLDLKDIDVQLMKKWSRQDSVDTRERDRNKELKQEYGYNNRFVSCSWLVGFIV
jgi:hypothetical protein